MKVEDEIAKAVEDGLDELVVRVSRYGHLAAAANEPIAWQAIAKFQNQPNGPWGVAIRDNPTDAIVAAMEAGRTGGSSITADLEDIFG